MIIHAVLWGSCFASWYALLHSGEHRVFASWRSTLALALSFLSMASHNYSLYYPFFICLMLTCISERHILAGVGAALTLCIAIASFTPAQMYLEHRYEGLNTPTLKSGYYYNHRSQVVFYCDQYAGDDLQSRLWASEIEYYIRAKFPMGYEVKDVFIENVPTTYTAANYQDFLEVIKPQITVTAVPISDSPKGLDSLPDNIKVILGVNS